MGITLGFGTTLGCGSTLVGGSPWGGWCSLWGGVHPWMLCRQGKWFGVDWDWGWDLCGCVCIPCSEKVSYFGDGLKLVVVWCCRGVMDGTGEEI